MTGEKWNQLRFSHRKYIKHLYFSNTETEVQRGKRTGQGHTIKWQSNMADLTPKASIVTRLDCHLRLIDIQRKGRLTKSNEKDGKARRVKYHTNVGERSFTKLDIQSRIEEWRKTRMERGSHTLALSYVRTTEKESWRRGLKKQCQICKFWKGSTE